MPRPLGASIADWLGKRPSLSGIGRGDGPVAGVAAIVIAILVGYLAIARTDIQPGIDQGVRSADPC